MFSKRIGFSLLGLLISAYLFTGCSYFFEEGKPEEVPYELTFGEKGSVACLSDNTQMLEDYFNLRGSDRAMRARVLAMKDCVTDAVDLFVRYGEGTAEPDVFEADEVHGFLSNIIEGYKYDVNLLEEAILLKASLIGGSRFSFTRSELQEVVSIFRKAYDILADFSGQRQFLFSTDSMPLTESNKLLFDGAAERFKAAISSFTSEDLKTTGLFDYDSLSRLILILIDDEASDWVKTLRLIDRVQAMVTNGRRSEIRADKLAFGADQLAALWLEYNKFNKFLKDDVFYKDFMTVAIFPGLLTRLLDDAEVFRGLKGQMLSEVLGNVLDVVDTTIKTLTPDGLRLSYFDEIIFVLHSDGNFSEDIKPESLTVLLPELFGRWTKQQSCEEPCESNVLLSENITVLKGVKDRWLVRQQFLDRQTFTGDTESLMRNATTNNLLESEFAQAADIVKNNHWGDYLMIGVETRTYKDLSILNAIYTMADIFLKPFNWDKTSELEYAMTEDEVQEFYDWMRPLLVDLQLADARGQESGRRAFTEANLFTSMAADAEHLSLVESLEYIQMLISTGQRASYFADNHFQSCHIEGLFDIFEYPQMDPECFRREYYENFEAYYLEAFPLLSEYITSPEGVSERPFILENIERASRQGFVTNSAAFDSDAIRVASSVLQDAEILYIRFDENKDGVIRGYEFAKALEHIKPNIRVLMERSLDEDTLRLVDNAFPEFEKLLVTFAIKHGQLPSLLFNKRAAARGAMNYGALAVRDAVGTTVGADMRHDFNSLGNDWQRFSFNVSNFWNSIFSDEEPPDQTLEVADGLTIGMLEAQMRSAETDQERDLIQQIIDVRTNPSLPAAQMQSQLTGLLAALTELREWQAEMDEYISINAIITRKDVLQVISSLANFNRNTKLDSIMDVISTYQGVLDATVNDPNADVFTDIINSFGCSSDDRDEVREWFFDIQIKWQDALINSEAALIGRTSWFDSWEEPVLMAIVNELRDDPHFARLCSVPYMEGVHEESDWYSDIPDGSEEVDEEMVIQPEPAPRTQYGPPQRY